MKDWKESQDFKKKTEGAVHKEPGIEKMDARSRYNIERKRGSRLQRTLQRKKVASEHKPASGELKRFTQQNLRSRKGAVNEGSKFPQEKRKRCRKEVTAGGVLRWLRRRMLLSP